MIAKSKWLSYHYVVPWDWKNGEFGVYNKDWSTLFIKLWYEFGHVKNLLSVTPDDSRAILQDIVEKKFSLEDGLSELKRISEYKAAKKQLTFQL